GSRGGARRDRSVHGRHSRDGRRRKLRAQHLQPRRAQPPAARIVVQAVRLCRGARSRVLAGLGPREPAPRARARRSRVDAAHRRRRSARHADAARGARGPVAGKTGTTDDYHDAWFVGYSTSVVVGVWVGFDQPAPIGRDAYGARVALPIWADFMKRTARQLPAREFTVPPDVHTEELCSVSYLQPVEGCPTYTEYFKSGDSVPSQLCPIHRGTIKQRAARAIDGFFRGL